MPEYTFYCDKCKDIFCIVCSIKDYTGKHPCSCGNVSYRSYVHDLSTINAAIKKHDTELKTIGDLAARNTERMSEDQKISLHHKHNSYKEEPSDKPLPKGMSRIKKPPKTIWPGTTNTSKKRRKANG